MTDDLFRQPFGGEDDDAETSDKLREMPSHELDDDTTVGGGLMSSGATAEDRGTGELGGQAQRSVGEDRDDDLVGINEGAIAGPPAGGAQTYVPAFIDDDDREGGSLPDA